MSNERESILSSIEIIKLQEEGFKSKWWKGNFFSTIEYPIQVKHISEIDLKSLSPQDLVRFFEYIIRCQVDISSNRVRQHYFKK